MTITVGGQLLGETWLERGGEKPKTLTMELGSAGREVRVIPNRSDELPKIESLGKAPASISVATERCFGTPALAHLWMIDLGSNGGFTGKGVFREDRGGSREIEYVVANVRSATSQGATVFINWELILGREMTC